jgi:hypothetical protein
MNEGEIKMPGYSGLISNGMVGNRSNYPEDCKNFVSYELYGEIKNLFFEYIQQMVSGYIFTDKESLLKFIKINYNELNEFRERLTYKRLPYIFLPRVIYLVDLAEKSYRFMLQNFCHGPVFMPYFAERMGECSLFNAFGQVYHGVSVDGKSFDFYYCQDNLGWYLVIRFGDNSGDYVKKLMVDIPLVEGFEASGIGEEGFWEKPLDVETMIGTGDDFDSLFLYGYYQFYKLFKMVRSGTYTGYELRDGYLLFSFPDPFVTKVGKEMYYPIQRYNV